MGNLAVATNEMGDIRHALLGSKMSHESDGQPNPSLDPPMGANQTAYISTPILKYQNRKESNKPHNPQVASGAPRKGGGAGAGSNGLDNLCGLIVLNQCAPSPLPCRCPQVWRNQNGYITVALLWSPGGEESRELCHPFRLQVSK